MMLQYLNKGTSDYVISSCIALMAFAFIVSIVDIGAAGRTYAAYGAIYIATACAFFAFTEQDKITRFDVIGASVAVIGGIIILVGAMISTK